MTGATKQRIRTASLWLAAIVALVVLFYAARWLTRKRLPVRVAESRVSDLVKSTSTNGKIEPINNFEAHAPIPTTVTKIYVTSGERVKAGELLLRLDDATAKAQEAAASAALRGAEAQLQAVQGGGTHQQQLVFQSNLEKAGIERRQAAASLKTVEALEKQGAAAPNEVAQAQQQLAIATASLQALEQQKQQPYSAADLSHARSSVTQAREAYRAAAQVVAQCNVTAPYAGTVYALPVTQYEYVQAGARLLDLADLKKLRVRAYFDEPEVGNLEIGDPATIIWDAKPGMTWHGRITTLPSTIIAFGTRNVGVVLINIDDSDGVLLPDTNVTVTVTTNQIRNALTVPREALHIENGKDYLYMVKGDSLHRVAIQVGALNLTDVQVLSGIEANETVALGATNGAPLTEGVPIRVVKQ